MLCAIGRGGAPQHTAECEQYASGAGTEIKHASAVRSRAVDAPHVLWDVDIVFNTGS